MARAELGRAHTDAEPAPTGIRGVRLKYTPAQDEPSHRYRSSGTAGSAVPTTCGDGRIVCNRGC